jgi:hypothetical protein
MALLSVVDHRLFLRFVDAGGMTEQQNETKTEKETKQLNGGMITNTTTTRKVSY